jgi:predicted dehydrogenase
MRFALLGSHPDGLEIASALVEVGGHELAACSSPSVPAEYLRRWGPQVKMVGDLEEVLADPAVEAIVVAGSVANRAHQLRRALQSERHVLCVHPADDSPDIGHEAAMIQGDTQRVLLPLLTEALHPGIARLKELLSDREGPVGTLRLIEMERQSTSAVLLDAGVEGHKPSVPGWDVLRRLGGEIAEVAGFAAKEELDGDEPLLLAGRFEQGGLFQAALLPRRERPYYRVVVVGEKGEAELLFPQGWPGPAFLSWRTPDSESHEEAWDAWDPWSTLVEVFGREVEGYEREHSALRAPRPTPRDGVTWQDAVRGLELDDAARRSVERRRASTLEYAEATEEVGFKGTMTLVGCGLLWCVLLLLILSRWLPWLGWVVVPVLVVFLILQLLRWVVPAHSAETKKQGPPDKPPP